MKRLGPNAHCVNLKLNHTVPASVRLLPAKEYRGAAIGISYDLRVFTGKRARRFRSAELARSIVRQLRPVIEYCSFFRSSLRKREITTADNFPGGGPRRLGAHLADG